MATATGHSLFPETMPPSSPRPTSRPPLRPSPTQQRPPAAFQEPVNDTSTAVWEVLMRLV